MKREELAKDLFAAQQKTLNLFSRNGALGSSVSSEVKTLRIIKNNDGQVYPSDISKELGVTTPRITTILNKMEDEGLIERKITNFDRRKVAVTLSDKGKELCDDIDAKELAKIEEIIKEIGADDAQAVIKYFKVFEKTFTK